jgi:hypothetical protein
MSDTKDTELAPEDLDKVAGGVGHGIESDFSHGIVNDGGGSHIQGGAGGLGGSHSK